MTGAGHTHPRQPAGNDGWLPRAEHVWVTHIAALGNRALPGLLLAWRRRPERPAEWQGWVIYVEAGSSAHGDGPYIRQSWVPGNGIKRRD